MAVNQRDSHTTINMDFSALAHDAAAGAVTSESCWHLVTRMMSESDDGGGGAGEGKERGGVQGGGERGVDATAS